MCLLRKYIRQHIDRIEIFFYWHICHNSGFCIKMNRFIIQLWLCFFISDYALFISGYAVFNSDVVMRGIDI